MTAQMNFIWATGWKNAAKWLNYLKVLLLSRCASKYKFNLM